MNFYNPYNNNMNNMYGNTYFRQPTQTSVPQQTSFLAPMNNIQLASLDEAKAYILTPNSQMLFLDKDKQRCYLKTADAYGQSNLEIYNLQKQEQTQEIQTATVEPIPKEIDLSGYAKNENVDSLKQELETFREEITKKLNDINKKVELKSSLENINQSLK